MRSLTLTETLNVTGAGYADDIVATAATLYVGNTLAGIGIGLGSALCASLPTAGAFAPLGAAGSVVITLAAPLALPLAAVGLVLNANPQFESTLIDKFHSYFG